MEEINFFLSTDISIGMGLFEKAADFIKKQGSKKPGLIVDANLQGENYFDENLNKIKNSIPGCILLANEKNSEPTYAYLEEVKTELKKLSKLIKLNYKETLKSRIPLDRFGDPKDVANTVLFLCSNLSDYITGETIHVNGGMYFS